MRRIALACLVVPGLFVSWFSSAVASPLPDEPHVYVEGSAEVEVAPDQMTVTVGLSETHEQLRVAKQTVDERSWRLLEAAKKLGIAKEDIATTALQVAPAYEYRNGEQIPLGSRVYRQVDLTLRDLSRYGDLMAALVDADISNTVDTRLKVSNEKALTDRALIAAMDDARQRAEAMAKAMGHRLGQVHSLSEFSTRRDEQHQLFSGRGIEGNSSGAMADAEAFRQAGEPFEPGLMVARAQVYVVFLIK